jgi:hypothetical protein
MNRSLRRYHIFFSLLSVFIAALLIFLTLHGADRAHAAPSCLATCFVSTTGNDANSGTTAGTALRNIQTAVDQVNNGGTVQIAAGTYNENIVIPGGKNVTIDGAGAASTTVDGGDAGNVFTISGGTVTISDLEIRDGAPSGFDQGNGIASEFANLTVLRVVITSNEGAGIYSNLGNDLTVTSSTISDNTSFTGGGIRQEVGGDLIVTASTISGNSATSIGGGIYLSRASSASITRSTISGNSAPTGAGIFNANTDPLTIANSTISGNEASSKGGGIGNINDGDSDCSNCSSVTTIINSTIFDNSAPSGAGIQNESIFGGLGDGFPINPVVLTISNSIVASNTPQNCVNSVTGGGSATFTSNGFNISSDTTCSPFFTGSGDQNNTNPLLNTLADNGGGTQTHSLLAGSPALGSGSAAICAAAPISNVDQRNQARPQGGGNCDRGAFESNLAPPPTTGSIGITKQTIPDGSLTEFEFNPSYAGPNFFLSDGEGTLRPNLTPGVYTIEEIVPIGWRLIDVDCGVATHSPIFSASLLIGVSVTVVAGQTANCTFTNERLSAIIIDKVAAGGGATEFDFTYDDPTAAPIFNFSLTDGDAPQIFQNIPTGTYIIREVNPPPGWVLNTIVCDNADVFVFINGPEITIDLGVDEVVTCTFTNVPPTPTTPAPTTPAPTTETPSPTTPAPTTETPSPTTPAPTTETPSPTTPAPTFTPVPGPSVSCPADTLQVGAFSDTLMFDVDLYHAQDHYTLTLPDDGNLTLTVVSMVGHPDDGCPASGAPTCNQGQVNEAFNILINDTPLAFVPDHGEDQWAVFNFDFGAFMAGDYRLTFAHALTPGGIGSVSYNAVACLTPPVEVAPVEEVAPLVIEPTPEATPTPEPSPVDTPVPTEETPVETATPGEETPTALPTDEAVSATPTDDMTSATPTDDTTQEGGK